MGSLFYYILGRRRKTKFVGLKLGTLNDVFSVTYYLELRNAILIYRESHTLSTNVKLVVGHLEHKQICLGENYINSKKKYSIV